MKECQSNEWFRNWFDSSYYHMLYRHRDDNEAGMFLENLLGHLNLPKKASILDLACGRGRHAVQLHSMGYDVLGLDLSACSIRIASVSEEPGLQFKVMDMRTFELNTSFDCILNLFTSFGYFSNHDENRKVLCHVKQHLKKDGIFVLDYLNPEIVRGKLHPEQHLMVDNVQFTIRKYIENDTVIKEIGILDAGNFFRFEERVQLLTAEVLCEMIGSAGLSPLSTYGDYQLRPFHQESSDRMIIIAKN